MELVLWAGALPGGAKPGKAPSASWVPAIQAIPGHEGERHDGEGGAVDVGAGAAGRDEAGPPAVGRLESAKVGGGRRHRGLTGTAAHLADEPEGLLED